MFAYKAHCVGVEAAQIGVGLIDRDDVLIALREGKPVIGHPVMGQVTPSPVVELNRAVAVSMADGPAAGLALVEALAGEPALKRYHLLPGVRGDLLAKLGRHREAADAFDIAVAMTQNARERQLMQDRAAKERAAGA